MLLRLVLERLLLLLRLHTRWLVDNILVYIVDVKTRYSQVLGALSGFMAALRRDDKVGVPREDLGES
jgi:hypothetical protein